MRIKLLVLLVALSVVLGANGVDNQDPSDQQEGFTIDQALSVLQDLSDTASLNLADLKENWKSDKEGLDAQLGNANRAVDNQVAQCNTLDGVVQKTTEDIEDTRKFITWLETSITNKKDKLDELLHRRCEVNKNFIDGLKRDKIALSLLEFIRTAVQNKQSFSLSQRAEFNKHLTSFLAAYSSNNVSFLLQMKDKAVDASDFNVDVDFSTQGRTDEEIGTGHVDNTKGELDLDDFSGSRRKDWQLYKEELVAILDNLKAEIQKKIKQSIDDEINASVALAEYKNTVLHEIEQFERQLKQENKNLVDLLNQLPVDQDNVTQCRQQINLLVSIRNTLQSEIERQETEFQKKQTSLQEEVDLLNEVVALYQAEVANNSDQFKSRQDDYIEDGNFDDGTYNNREVPEIKTLSSENSGEVVSAVKGVQENPKKQGSLQVND